jgi:hypothetical protein
MRYTYKNDTLVDENGLTVMMGWERPVMKKVSEIITFNGGDILNIGFGMGIIDTYINESKSKTHTIIESHPDVIGYMKDNNWEDKANCIYGRWQDQSDTVGYFDGIYLDTWMDQRVPFIPNFLDKCLKVGGVFSIWYNQIEFDSLLEILSEDYEVSYIEMGNDGLIPEQQYEKGGFYINPVLEKITIPIITRLR